MVTGSGSQPHIVSSNRKSSLILQPARLMDPRWVYLAGNEPGALEFERSNGLARSEKRLLQPESSRLEYTGSVGVQYMVRQIRGIQPKERATQWKKFMS